MTYSKENGTRWIIQHKTFNEKKKNISKQTNKLKEQLAVGRLQKQMKKKKRDGEIITGFDTN